MTPAVAVLRSRGCATLPLRYAKGRRCEAPGARLVAMTKRKGLSEVNRRKAGKRDLQVEEFEKRDLGDDIRAAGGLRPIGRPCQPQSCSSRT